MWLAIALNQRQRSANPGALDVPEGGVEHLSWGFLENGFVFWGRLNMTQNQPDYLAFPRCGAKFCCRICGFSSGTIDNRGIRVLAFGCESPAIDRVGKRDAELVDV